jgi:hypothetical protein
MALERILDFVPVGVEGLLDGIHEVLGGEISRSVNVIGSCYSDG